MGILPLTVVRLLDEAGLLQQVGEASQLVGRQRAGGRQAVGGDVEAGETHRFLDHIHERRVEAVHRRKADQPAVQFHGLGVVAGVEGLGLLKGEILRIPDKEGLKIPHMGWNSIHLQNGGRLFKGISQESYVYFVHSYYLKAEEEEIIKATTEYSTHIHASVEKGNLFACQFHPEKSSDLGLAILKNFAEIGEED